MISRQTSAELLRLRGEVARLRGELESFRREEKDEAKKSQEQNRETSGASLNEIYGISGIDTNNLPIVKVGAKENEVVNELGRVGANLIAQENYPDGDGYIEAVVSPTMAAGTNMRGLAMRMEFHFEDGKLTSRKISHVVANR